MITLHGLTHRGRRPAGRVVAVSFVLALAACGLPEGSNLTTVQDSDVPYNLLDPQGPRSAPGGDAAPVPVQVPVVFWLRKDERLVPSAVDAACTDGAAAVVGQVLVALAVSPTPEERTDGLASAIPPSAQLELLGLDDGVAQIELDPVTLGDAEQLPLAVGQLVLSVTSAPDVDAVSLLTSGRSVDVPLPGGALAARPVTADDYGSLLADRLVARQGGGLTPSADIGCPASRG